MVEWLKWQSACLASVSSKPRTTERREKERERERERERSYVLQNIV
jgi:hypothetical protein